MMNPRSRIRWKSLLALTALPWIGVLLLFFLPAWERYSHIRSVGVLGAVLVSLLLAVAWLLTISGLAWRTRGKALLLLLALGGAFAGVLRNDSLTGDALPQFSWRWQPRTWEALAPLRVTLPAGGQLAFTTDQPGDSPRFMGPGGGNWVDSGMLSGDWCDVPPKVLWRRPVGPGWGGITVAGEYAITQEQRGEEEITVAYRLSTGDPLWQHSEKAKFEEALGGNGPRATPTAHDGKIYTLGATGILVCLDGRTGALLWRRDTLAENGQENLTWAKSSSPLISGDHVITTLGKGPEALAAYHATTGEPVWRGAAGSAGYCTPVSATINGTPQILCLLADSAGGYDAATGREIWSWTGGIDPNATTTTNPVFIPPDRVLISIGYGVGSTLLRITPGAAAPEILWESLKMKPKFTNPAVRGHHVWCLDEGRLVCLDLEDGKSLWRGSSYGHGQILGAGGFLIIQTERGDIVVAEANPAEEKVRARFPALSSKTWNQPCLAGRHLLVRNDREMVCFELKGAPGKTAAVR